MTYSVGLNVWMENQSPGLFPSPLSRYVLICQAAGSVLRGSIYICVKCRRLCLPGAESSFPAWHTLPWSWFWGARGHWRGSPALLGFFLVWNCLPSPDRGARSVGKLRQCSLLQALLSLLDGRGSPSCSAPPDSRRTPHIQHMGGSGDTRQCRGSRAARLALAGLPPPDPAPADALPDTG